MLAFDFKLRNSQFLVNQRTVPNGKIGAVIHSAFYDPDAIETRPVQTNIDHIDINFGVKIGF